MSIIDLFLFQTQAVKYYECVSEAIIHSGGNEAIVLSLLVSKEMSLLASDFVHFLGLRIDLDIINLIRRQQQ